MHILHLCAAIKERVSAELQEASHPHERGAILIAALYELSRSVLPELGPPRKSDEYAQRQEAVLDLITFIAIHLIRGPEHERRGVAVLSELAEGCEDLLLKKKLSVYAQELLAKSNGRPPKNISISAPRAAFLAGLLLLTATLLYHVWPALIPEPRQRAPLAVPAVPEVAPRAPAPSVAAAASPAEGGAEGAVAGEREKGEEARPQQPVAAEKAVAVTGEHVTRVRISNSQVLVPVMLRNGGESLKVELVLDTGATRSAIRDGLTSRLRIDLRNARMSLAEVADGRVVSSRVARIDALVVGPFAMTPAELEIIPYKGSEGMHDGLLGMDFLGKRRYQIDMEREVIRWF